MITQLRNRSCLNIIVIDNLSTYPPMVEYLDQIDRTVSVVRLPENIGPHYVFRNQVLFPALPPHFCVTDPDLEFNKNLPSDFMEQLLDLTEEFKVGKAGFAIDISDKESMIETEFIIHGKRRKVWEWEFHNWSHRLRDQIYKAGIDTTFAVYNKKYFTKEKFYDAVRVAGDFTCRHLPWYKENRLPKDEEEFYRKASRYSYFLSREHVPSQVEKYQLGDINLLYVLDHGSTDRITQQLRSLVETVFQHPAGYRITVLILTTGMDTQILNSLLMSVVANLIVESSIDLSAGEPTFVFVSSAHDLDWRFVIHHITALLTIEGSEPPVHEPELANLEIIPLEQLKEQYWEES